MSDDLVTRKYAEMITQARGGDRYAGIDDPERWLREADACERDGYDITAAMLRSAAEQVQALRKVAAQPHQGER